MVAMREGRCTLVGGAVADGLRRGQRRAPAGSWRRAAPPSASGWACPRARARRRARCPAAPGRNDSAGPRNVPPELARLAGAGGSLARSASKRWRWRSFMGSSGWSAQARWLMTSVGLEGGEQIAARPPAGRPRPRACRAGSCRCRCGRRRPAARPRARQ